jgi:hypothetical protein
MMVSSSVHFPATISCVAKLCISTAFSLTIYQLMGIYTDSIAWLVNTAAIKVGAQASLLYADLNFFRYMPSGIAGSYGSSIFRAFLFEPSYFYSCYTIPSNSPKELLFSTSLPTFVCMFSW